jgi:hypothetical protein
MAQRCPEKSRLQAATRREKGNFGVKQGSGLQRIWQSFVGSAA